MVLFKVVGYFLYYILIARCWLLFIPYPITGLFDERWTFLLRESCRVCRSSPGVVLGDLVDVAVCGSKIVLCISEQIYTLRGGWMVAGKGVRCMQCLCWGFVLGRRGRLSRRSSIQVDEISCIRDHLK